jgi:alpha-ribazole phosphatase
MEIDFGSWEGRNWDDIDRGLFDAWAADLLEGRAHGGESLMQLRRRVAGWFDEVSEGGTGPIHVVTHAGVIRVLAGYLLGIELLLAIRWVIDFGGIVWVRKVHGQWVLVGWNL